MRLQSRILTALGAFLFVFQVAAATALAADRKRLFDSGQPRELINHPVCGPGEELDDPRYCDYAQRT